MNITPLLYPLHVLNRDIKQETSGREKLFYTQLFVLYVSYNELMKHSKVCGGLIKFQSSGTLSDLLVIIYIKL